MKHISKSRGFTVIELLIVIAIIVAAVVAIVNRVQSARQSSQVTSEAGNLSAIESKVKSSFSGRPNYAGLSTAVLLAQNGFPAQMVNAGVVSHVWGGTVAVAAGAGNTSMDITYSSVPSAACLELILNVSRTYSEVTVGGTKTKNGAAISDLDTTTTACQAAALANITFNTL
jgi:prepilin-type N-terminal cleavage/methylation domain-containing protein